MVFHDTSIHRHLAVAGIYHIVRRDLSVFKSYHDRGRFESRPRLEHITNSIVAHFVVLTVFALHHTYIDSTNQIATINWWHIDNVQVFVHHLLTVCQSVPPFQDGVESKFDTISRSFGCVCIHISQCTGSQ